MIRQRFDYHIGIRKHEIRSLTLRLFFDGNGNEMAHGKRDKALPPDTGPRLLSEQGDGKRENDGESRAAQVRDQSKELIEVGMMEFLIAPIKQPFISYY